MPTSVSRERSSLAAASLLVPVLIVARLLARASLYTYDDAFISFRYARNFAEGHGLVFNVGELVLGTTTPGYAVLLGLLGMLGLPIEPVAVAVNLLAEIGVLLLVGAFVLERSEPRTAALFGGLFAASPILARVSVGGMEMCLFLFVSILAIVLYHRGSTRTAIAIAAIGYFLRPEAVILVGVLCITEFFVGRRGHAFVLAAIALAVVAPGILAIHLTYGQPFSQSVMAKSTLETPPITQIPKQFLFPDPLAGLLFLPALWGAVVAWRRGGAIRTVVVWAGAYYVLYQIARPWIWSWYGEPIYFAVVLAGALGIADLAGRWLPAHARRVRTGLALAAGLGAIGLWGAVYLRQSPHPVRAEVQEPLRDWLAANTDSTTTFVAYDVGALGYYSRAHITDMAGLVSKGVVEIGSHTEVIRRTKAEYLFLAAVRNNIAIINEPDLQALYRPILRISPDTATGMSLDTNAYSTTWSHDYVIFQRQ